MQRGSTTAPDGTLITWRLWGEATAPRVACIHSLALHGGMWEGVARALGDRAQVLAIDCRGHGESGRAAGPYDTATMAGDLAAVFDALGWDKAVVAGCSMGGCVAQSLAIGHPARTAGLVLMDTTAWYGPDAPANWHQRAETGKYSGLDTLRPFQAERWFSDAFNAAHPEILAHWLDVFVATDRDCYAASCEMLGTTDLRALLPGIATPTRVLVGEQDHATPPAMAKLLAETIPGATLRIIPAARHITPVECPDVIAETIAELL